MEGNQKCKDASKMLYEALKKVSILKHIVIFEPYKGGYCFWVKFIKPIREIYLLSISFPVYPEVVETALINAHGELCYIEDVGYPYQEVRGFESDKAIESITEEIIRISSFR